MEVGSNPLEDSVCFFTACLEEGLSGKLQTVRARGIEKKALVERDTNKR